MWMHRDALDAGSAPAPVPAVSGIWLKMHPYHKIAYGKFMFGIDLDAKCAK